MSKSEIHSKRQSGRFVSWCGVSCLLLPFAALDKSELEGLPVPGTEPQEGLERQTWLAFEVIFFLNSSF